MKKTGGKMNAACMFWDDNGNKALSYHPITGKWDSISTEAEFARARQFTSIYNVELKRLSEQYGEKQYGKVSLNQIQNDMETKKDSGSTGTYIDYTI